MEAGRWVNDKQMGSGDGDRASQVYADVDREMCGIHILETSGMEEVV